MGVIYKLKQEVVDFIIVKKKENPALSCRQITSLAIENFEINISKSSVNTVLKQNHLSSLVGRKSVLVVSGTKKFYIPIQKKKEMLEKIHQLKDEHKENFPLIPGEKESFLITEEEKKTAESPAPAALFPTEMKREAESHLRSLTNEESIEMMSCASQGQAYKELYLDTSPRPKNDFVYDGAGMVFLKAAEWEISRKSFLGTLLQKYADGPLPEGFSVQCEALLWKALFALSENFEENARRWRTLIELNGMNSASGQTFGQPNALTIPDLLKDIEFSRQFVMEYTTQREQAFLEVRGFQLNLEDKTSFFIDGQMSSLGNDRVSESNFCPMEKALTALSRNLISQLNPTVLHFQNSSGDVCSDIRQLIGCFENLEGKRVENVKVYDAGSQPLATFTTIPKKKRQFIIGLDLGQNEWGEWSRRIGLQENAMDDFGAFAEGGGDKFFFIEKKNVNIFVGTNRRPLKKIWIWKSGSEKPFLALITNVEGINPEDILKQYFSQFPLPAFREKQTEFFQKDTPKREEKKLEKLQLTSEEQVMGILDFKAVFHSFGLALHDYCLRHYFSHEDRNRPFVYFKQKYYDLKGTIQTNARNLHVILKPPAEHPCLHDLWTAAKRINEIQVLDQIGRKLLINIEL